MEKEQSSHAIKTSRSFTVSLTLTQKLQQNQNQNQKPRTYGHFPDKPGLTCCSLDSQPSVILILSILKEQAKTPTYITCCDNITWGFEGFWFFEQDQKTFNIFRYYG